MSEPHRPDPDRDPAARRSVEGAFDRAAARARGRRGPRSGASRGTYAAAAGRRRRARACARAVSSLVGTCRGGDDRRDRVRRAAGRAAARDAGTDDGCERCSSQRVPLTPTLSPEKRGRGSFTNAARGTCADCRIRAAYGCEGAFAHRAAFGARQEKANATPVKPAAPAPREVTQPESRPPAVAQASRDAMTAAAPAPPPERAEPRPFPGQEAPSAAAPPPAAPPTALTKAESQAPGFAARRRESDERAATRDGQTPMLRRPHAAPAPVAKLATRPPAAWIERIRMLHAEQRFDEAARELNAFRDAYPDADARLPESLRAWAASVPRAR